MTRAHAIVDKLLENEGGDYVKSEVERLEPLHRIVTSFSTVRFADDGSGNYDEEHGWVDEFGEDMEPDEIDVEDSADAVSKAVFFLSRKGALEPSSSDFHTGVWYSSGYDENYSNGEQTEEHYHLKGFTDEEQARVYAALASLRRR